MTREGYETVVKVGDALSLGVLLGYFTSALPSIATFTTIVWTIIRIYEMDTVQRWLKKGKYREPTL